MKKITNKTQKFPYVQPCIKCVKLDNEISLQLESEIPPFGPNETYNLNKPEFFNTTPFQDRSC